MAAASPPAEAKGDRLMAQARRELTGFWSCLLPASATYSYAAGFFEEAAKAYRLAKNWRKAALAHHEYGTYCIKMGRDCRLAAAVVLWESAECHMRDFDPDDEQTARAIESDLKRSVRMLVLENQPQLAASACEELARMYVARRRGSGTSEPRGTASSSAGPGLYRKPSPPPSEEQ
ncbi:hypothetical protein [Oryza sativa Japonica Group]|uniref:Uncharacterized protein n=2 Tax=Oryza sativa subsp. japonica TaxID=39947 RepID=Q8S1Z3_ORYSJ|nr:hypothetical protein OsJ_03817 [Oryza sativa Japonica Group]BAB89636.1 hypothetical protein [Oryza sativa Japonica Group]